jgi:iron complex outermembrane recepter protein
MNKTPVILGAVLFCGALAVAAPAATNSPIDQYLAHYRVVRSDVPLPAKVVGPVDLSRRYIGSLVTIDLTVDASGQPRDISVVSRNDPELARAVISAVAQWRFTPAQKDGKPVEARIRLPIRLAEDPMA